MMARDTNVPFKGRIQKRKTCHLQIITFGLQRAAGPYRCAMRRRQLERRESSISRRSEPIRSNSTVARHLRAVRPVRWRARVTGSSIRLAGWGFDGNARSHA